MTGSGARAAGRALFQETVFEAHQSEEWERQILQTASHPAPAQPQDTVKKAAPQPSTTPSATAAAAEK